MVLLMFNQRTVGLYHFRLMQTIRGVQEKVEASTDVENLTLALGRILRPNF